METLSILSKRKLNLTVDPVDPKTVFFLLVFSCFRLGQHNFCKHIEAHIEKKIEDGGFVLLSPLSSAALEFIAVNFFL